MSATVGQLDGIKAGQQRMWASGNSVAVGARIHPIVERLCETADLAAGSPVLDVATGSGNAAIAAARCGCDVVRIDYVPELHLDQLLGCALVRLEVSRREFVFRFRSTTEFVGVFRDYYGPVHKAFDALDENDRRQLYEDLIQLAIRHDREPGPSVAIPSAYVEAMAVRAS